MIFDFTGKNVLITGGSRGIGKACAQLFADANASVIITYKSNSKEAEKTFETLKKSGVHSMYQLDVSSSEDIEKVYSKILQQYHNIDVLVNNAGVFIEHKIAEVSYADWQRIWNKTIAANLIGVSNLCYLVAGDMMKHKQGKIVNISSRGAFRGEPDHPAYGASKAGLNAMSQSLAIALAPYNITVGVVAPGFVQTDMTAAYLHSEAGEQIKKQSPMNRVATAEEVARVVGVLASEGVDFMTGGIVDLNGASYLRS